MVSDYMPELVNQSYLGFLGGVLCITRVEDYLNDGVDDLGDQSSH